MRFRGSMAIDLGTVNTLVWVAGRGIVLEEPTAIAIDTAVGKVAAVGAAADALADKEPQDIQVIHPLRDGVHRGPGRDRGHAARVPAADAPVQPDAARRPGVRAERRHTGRAPVDHRRAERPAAQVQRAADRRAGGRRGRRRVRPDRRGGRVRGRHRRRHHRGRGGGRLAGGQVPVAAQGRQRHGRRDHAGRAERARADHQPARGPAPEDDARGHRRGGRLRRGGRPGRRAADAAVRVRAGRPGGGRPRADRGGDRGRGARDAVRDPGRAGRGRGRGKVRLAGGGALLPGLAARIETAAGIGTVLVEDPLRCVLRGAAEILERKDAGPGSGPGLRH